MIILIIYFYFIKTININININYLFNNMDNTNNEQKLINLGLTAKQIEMVLGRLSPENVQLFINEFNKEKSTLNRNNISVSRNNIFQNQTMYQPRIIPNFSEKMSAKDMNTKYEEKSKFRNDPSENLEILSIQLFGNPKLYNDIYLDKKYRQLCLKFHPDKNNGDNSQFTMLNNCYNHLKQKLYKNNHFQQNTHNTNRSLDKIVPPPDSLFENRFDNTVFNNYYNNNSFKTSSKGYGDWLKESNSEIKIPEKPNENNFNNVFENHKKQHYNTLNINNQLMKIQEIPDDNQCTSDDVFILGEDESKTEDFSGKTRNGINYTDIRRALETPHLIYKENNTFINNNISKDYQNIEQSHKSIPTQMTNREREIYDRNELKKKEKEENRMYTLKQNDEDIDHYFQKINTNRLTL